MRSTLNTRMHSEVLDDPDDQEDLDEGPSFGDVAKYCLELALWIAVIPLVLGLILKLWG